MKKDNNTTLPLTVSETETEAEALPVEVPVKVFNIEEFSLNAKGAASANAKKMALALESWEADKEDKEVGAINGVMLDIPIQNLVPFEYNPISRTEENNDLFKLTFNVMKYGLKVPLVVRPQEAPEVLTDGWEQTAKFDVIEGHRRLKVCETLGATTVTCIVELSEATSEELYVAINDTIRPHNGADRLYKFLQNEELVTEAQAKTLTDLQSLFGSDICKKTVAMGYAADFLNTIRILVTKVGNKGNGWKRDETGKFPEGAILEMRGLFSWITDPSGDTKARIKTIKENAKETSLKKNADVLRFGLKVDELKNLTASISSGMALYQSLFKDQ